MSAPLTKVELTGVPETALWNLYQRASAARAGHLDDPRAVEVLVRLDYPFERFDLPYRPPDWTWTVDTDELRQLRELPGLTNLHEVPQAGGDRLLGVLRRVPGLKSQLPTVPVFQARLGLDAA